VIAIVRRSGTIARRVIGAVSDGQRVYEAGIFAWS